MDSDSTLEPPPYVRPEKIMPGLILGETGALATRLDRFFDAGQLEELAQRALQLVKEGEAHSVDVKGRGPGSLHVGDAAGLTYDVFTSDLVEVWFPELWSLYQVTATALLRTTTDGVEFYPTAGKRGININVLPPNHAHEWHIGGPDLAFTSTFGLQCPTKGTPGGVFEWFNGQTYLDHKLQTGEWLVIPGHFPHGVTPCAMTRIVCVMSWTFEQENDLRGQEGLPKYLYGRDHDD